MKQLFVTAFLLSTTLKYGPSGYDVNSLTHYERCGNKCSVSVTQDVVTDKVQAVGGLRLQTLPEGSGISLGIGYYADKTSELSLGWKF